MERYVEYVQVEGYGFGLYQEDTGRSIHPKDLLHHLRPEPLHFLQRGQVVTLAGQYAVVQECLSPSLQVH